MISTKPKKVTIQVELFLKDQMWKAAHLPISLD